LFCAIWLISRPYDGQRRWLESPLKAPILTSLLPIKGPVRTRLRRWPAGSCAVASCAGSDPDRHMACARQARRHLPHVRPSALAAVIPANQTALYSGPSSFRHPGGLV
jgi:hypothetical protein